MNRFQFWAVVPAVIITLSAHGAQAENLSAGFLANTSGDQAYQVSIETASQWLPLDGTSRLGNKFAGSQTEVLAQWKGSDSDVSVDFHIPEYRKGVGFFGVVEPGKIYTNFPGAERLFAETKRSDPADAGDLLIQFVAMNKETNLFAKGLGANITYPAHHVRDSAKFAKMDPADAGILLQPYMLASAGM
jgi:hypothetical protein